MGEDRPILIRRDCLLLAGDLVVAALLSQIVYWYLPGKDGKSKLSVKRYGHFWIAKTRDQWMEETGLTIDQYRRAITVLKDKRLVEVRVMKFYDTTMSHVRLLQSIAGAVIPSVGGKPPNGVGGNPPPHQYTKPAHPGKGLSPAVLVHRLQAETKAQTTGVADRHALPGEDPDKIPGEEEQDQDPKKYGTKKEKSQMKATEILKAHSAPIKGDLGSFWKERVHTLTGKWQKPLTVKEKGQLSQLKTKLGYDDAKAVITFAIDSWWKFGTMAGAKMNEAFPLEPNIGYLLKHFDVAVDLLMTKDKGGPTITTEEPPVQLIANPEPDEVPHVMTPEEFTELMNALKAP